MDSRGRFLSRLASLSLALAAATCAYAQDSTAFPLTRSCDTESEKVATVQASDPLKVRYTLAAEIGTCYAVTATIDGKSVNGFLIRTSRSTPSHPAITEFEDQRRSQVLLPLAAPPAPQADTAAPDKAAPNETAATDKPAMPAAASTTPKEPAPLPVINFSTFHFEDADGDMVDLRDNPAKYIVIYFWPIQDFSKTQGMLRIYDDFHPRAVEVVGVAMGASLTQLRDIWHKSKFPWSEVPDSKWVASKYQIDMTRPYMLLDQHRNVIAAVSTPAELGPILHSLTDKDYVTPKRRR